MVFSNIEFKNFHKKKNNSKVKKNLNKILDNYFKGQDQILLSLSKKYKYKFKFEKINKYKKFKNFRIFGMGGSSLGAEAIYFFLNKKIKKKFEFVNNINLVKKKKFKEQKI